MQPSPQSWGESEVTWIEFEDGYLVTLESGEAVLESLTQFAMGQGISGAWLEGGGTLSEALLDRADGQSFLLSGALTLVWMGGAMDGTLGGPDLRLRASVADVDGNIKGGALVAAVVLDTVEVYVRNLRSRLVRITTGPRRLATSAGGIS